MIAVCAERCNGCGACLEVCPNGALYLIEGKAVVDETLCEECEACVTACPMEAIIIADQVTVPESRSVTTLRSAPEVVPVEGRPAQMPLRSRLLPVVGAVLHWAGRELVPRLAYTLLDGLDRRVAGQSTTGIARGGSGGSGRRQRHRHRGGV